MKIFTNTAISLDGKVNTRERKRFALGSKEDIARMGALRAQADAVLVGGNTFRAWPIPLAASGDRKDPLWNVVVSHRMNFKLTESYRHDPRIRPLFLTDRRMPPTWFPERVICAGKKITPAWIVKTLSELGIETLLIEGGGDLIAQFLDAGLIDEMFVTLCPFVIGGKKAPSLYEGTGFLKDRLPHLKLLSAEPREEEVFLHYEVRKGETKTKKSFWRKG